MNSAPNKANLKNTFIYLQNKRHCMKNFIYTYIFLFSGIAYGAAGNTYANQIADVVAVGQSAWEGVGDGKSWCKVGDVVLIARYAGQNRDDEETGDIYSFINDQDIIAYQRGNNE